MITSVPDIFGVRLPIEMPATPPWASAWTGLTPFAFWIVAALRPRQLVELGVYQGLSYCCFCEEVVQNGLETRCSGVDTWKGDVHNGEYGAEVLSSLRSYHDLKYAGFSELLQMPFDQAVGHFEDGSIDLLHIDGLHTYEAVRHDFETWRPKLSGNAVVLFHDIDVRHSDFGVWRFWDEIRSGRPHFALHHSNGLGILGMGSSYSDPMTALFAASGPKAEMVCSVFESLGDHVRARHNMQRKLEAAFMPSGFTYTMLNFARSIRRSLRSG
jgi:hypothetical protein